MDAHSTCLQKNDGRATSEAEEMIYVNVYMNAAINNETSPSGKALALMHFLVSFFFFSSRRRHTRCSRDWSSDVCSSDLTLRNTSDAAASFFWSIMHRPNTMWALT